MTEAFLDPLFIVAVNLPDDDLLAAGRAAMGGELELERYRAGASSTVIRSTCDLIAIASAQWGMAAVGGALLGIARARSHFDRRVDLVWTGPIPRASKSRLTSATIEDLIDRAMTSLLIVGYAVYQEHSVLSALMRAASRNVSIGLLLERTADNPRYQGPTIAPFQGIPATRWCWPAARRETDAALHAKVVVADRRWVMIGSANITQAALTKNLECGVILDRPDLAESVHRHIADLISERTLVELK